MRSTTSGSFTACATSAPSFTMISRGVPLGANRPKVGAKSNPGIVSAMAGTSGASSKRLSELIASIFTRPSFAWAASVGYPENTMGTCPPTTAGTLCPVPLYGTWVICRFNDDFRYSMHR